MTAVLEDGAHPRLYTGSGTSWALRTAHVLEVWPRKNPQLEILVGTTLHTSVSKFISGKCRWHLSGGAAPDGAANTCPVKMFLLVVPRTCFQCSGGTVLTPHIGLQSHVCIWG